MKLIVGLGNPGEEYVKTRHNIGFMVLDNYANDISLSWKKKFNGLYLETTVNNEKIILLKPQSFMNLSGTVISKYMKYFDIKFEDILIIYDDMDFSLGTFKIKKTGSSAGHNGIKNVIECLKTEDIKRIRIGISKNSNNKINYVLGKFKNSEQKIIDELIPILKDVINDFIINDFESVMAKYN